MATQADDISDIIKSTLKDLGRGRWTDIAANLQDYICLQQVLRKGKMGYSTNGYGIQWQILHNYGTQARHTGLYAVDNPDVENGLVNASIPWRHTETKYSFDVREPDMNASEEQIVDLIKVRRSMAFGALAELLETSLWTKPSSSTDTEMPFGIEYWVAWVTHATGDFVGANQSGFTAGPGGLSSSTYSGWKNFSAVYTTVATTDLVKKMRRMAVLTKFMAPYPQPSYASGTGQRQYYMPYSVLGDLEGIAVAQNDANGPDVASKDGKTLFRGNPMNWVPYLETNRSTSLPVYQIDWSVFKPVMLRNWYLKESAPVIPGQQHNVRTVYVDMSWNLCCYDRRKLGVIAKSDPING